MAQAYAQARIAKLEVPEATAIANMGKPFGGSPFDRFKREEDSGIYTPKHETNQKLDQIIAAWRLFVERCEAPQTTSSDSSDDSGSIWSSTSTSSWYDNAVELVKGLRCTADEVSQFVMILPEVDDGKTSREYPGNFLSALINTGPSMVYRIQTANIGAPIHFLGAHNSTKHILIEGNVGERVGFCMSGGRIEVNGNAKDYPGEKMAGGELSITGNVGMMPGLNMRDGTLTVGGNADNQTGDGMRGGRVVIHGSAGDGTGVSMFGGEIHIHGKCDRICSKDRIHGGLIFVGSVRVYPRLD